MIDINHDIKVNEKILPLSILNSDEPDYIRLLCFFQNIQCHPNLKPELGSITKGILYTDLLLESVCKQLGINRAYIRIPIKELEQQQLISFIKDDVRKDHYYIFAHQCIYIPEPHGYTKFSNRYFYNRKDLSIYEKAMLRFIIEYHHPEFFCRKQNQEIADALDITLPKTRAILSSLIKKQFIFIEFTDEEATKRRIRVPESVLEEAIVDYLKDKERQEKARIRNAKSKQPKKKALWQRVL